MQTDKHGHYPVRPDNALEFRRLSIQDEIFNDAFRLLPEGVIAPKHILDVGCGTGGWIRRVAQAYPYAKCTGLDKSDLLLGYARSVAESNKLANVTYKKGDMLEITTIFKQKRFDFIQMRFCSWFLGNHRQEAVAACRDLLEPGGHLHLMEYEPYPSTTSAALKRFAQLFEQALEKRGTSYAGTSEFPVLFDSLGFTNVQLTPYVIRLDAGATKQGTSNQSVLLRDLISSMQTVAKIIIAAGLISEKEHNDLIEQCIADAEKKEFGGLSYYLSITGQKPV